MVRPPVLRHADIVALRRLVTRGGDERLALLREAADRPLRAPSAMREWHDLLLFVAAHPRSDREVAWANEHLARVMVRVEQLPARVRAGLLNSGIAGAPVEGCFSLALVRWLHRQWPGRVVLASLGASLDDVRETLRALVLPVEQESVDSHVADAEDLLALLFGSSQSQWLPLLLARLDALAVPDAIREQWFARLQAYVRVDGAATDCSITLSRTPTGSPLFADTQRSVDVPSTLAQPAPPPLRLTASAARQLIDVARTVLCTMERETDPITFASAVSLYDMGRGLRIALFSLDVPHRLPFDSYVGFLALRNGVPLAYGGAWIFPGRSKVGINVFPSQRGGESAWFFAQLLRLYRGVFGVERFEAENYQLGYGNPEGLRSGAYWFYYRLGFRPTTPALQRVAARESNRLTERRGYVVPRAVLLTLVEAGLELTLRDSTLPPCDTAQLVDAVVRHIVTRYEGDRQRAIATARRRLHRILSLAPSRARDHDRDRTWTAPERLMLERWLLPLDLIDDLEHWSPAERRRLAHVIRSKGEANERRHQRLLRRHSRLLSAWAMAARA